MSLLILTSQHFAASEDDSLKDDNHCANETILQIKGLLKDKRLYISCQAFTRFNAIWKRLLKKSNILLFSSIGALVMQMLVCWSVCLLVSVYFLFVITQSIFMLGPPDFA